MVNSDGKHCIEDRGMSWLTERVENVCQTIEQDEHSQLNEEQGGRKQGQQAAETALLGTGNGAESFGHVRNF
jgi:hypothetical protein